MKFISTEPEGSHSDCDGALMMATVRTSETSVYSNETKRRYIAEGYNLC
jgi:hypothetical protein